MNLTRTERLGETPVEPAMPSQFAARPITDADLDEYLRVADRLERTPGADADAAWRSLYASFRQRFSLYGADTSEPERPLLHDLLAELGWTPEAVRVG